MDSPRSPTRVPLTTSIPCPPAPLKNHTVHWDGEVWRQIKSNCNYEPQTKQVRMTIYSLNNITISNH